MLRCKGCGGLVPDIDGPTHRYMPSAPGCWEAFGEVSVRAMEDTGAARLRHSFVDCYAVQHPTNAESDRRQRQSVGVHLVALCLSLEHGIDGVDLSRRRQRVSEVALPAAGLTDWPVLTPPDHLGDLTAVDLRDAGDAETFLRLGAAWAPGVWAAWHRHHDEVRLFARLVLASR